MGDVYVNDLSNHRIQKFNSNGDFILLRGGFGGEDGLFNAPQGIAVDSALPTNNVYVADTNNNRIQKFTLSP